MSTATTMEVDVAGAARGKHVATGERTVVASRLAAICNMIEEHWHADTPLSARRVAAISAMIDDLATTAAEGRPTARRRRKRRINSARWYEKVRALGAGAFGDVVMARHRATGRDVAVKSPLVTHGGGDNGQIAFLLREACFMAACQGQHPTLAVGFHGVVRAPGTNNYSLVMEYVGPNLAEVLAKRGEPFREAQVRPMMRRLLEAAVVMHEHGIVHRDIKPENILVGDGGALKICDFGAAKLMDESSIAGTDGYMAPEVLLWNEDHDTRADMWSLGCVMAELLTDDALFLGEDHAEQLGKIFDSLGAPGKGAWQTSNKELGEMVERWQALQRRHGHRSRLRELVPKEILSRDGFEVLKGLLTCDPNKRLSATAALRFPWFADNEPAATAISNINGVATESSWSSQAWQMAMSFTGRALQLLRAKLLFIK